MFRSLVALLMALAIANPVCCCALASEPDLAEVSTSCGCCKTSTEDQDKEEQVCQCFLAQDQVLTETQLNLSGSRLEVQFHAHDRSRDITVELTKIHSCWNERGPPDVLRFETVGRWLACYGVYRI